MKFLQKSLSRSSLWSNTSNHQILGDNEDESSGKGMDSFTTIDYSDTLQYYPKETLMTKMFGTIQKSFSRSSIKSPEPEFSDISAPQCKINSNSKQEEMPDEETAEQRALRRNIHNSDCPLSLV